jgi:hypothetical protein
MARGPKFKFLTMNEFCALPQGEKIAYIDDAYAQIKKMGGDAAMPAHVIFEADPKRDPDNPRDT